MGNSANDLTTHRFRASWYFKTFEKHFLKQMADLQDLVSLCWFVLCQKKEFAWEGTIHLPAILMPWCRDGVPLVCILFSVPINFGWCLQRFNIAISAENNHVTHFLKYMGFMVLLRFHHSLFNVIENLIVNWNFLILNYLSKEHWIINFSFIIQSAEGKKLMYVPFFFLYSYHNRQTRI